MTTRPFSLTRAWLSFKFMTFSSLCHIRKYVMPLAGGGDNRLGRDPLGPQGFRDAASSRVLDPQLQSSRQNFHNLPVCFRGSAARVDQGYPMPFSRRNRQIPFPHPHKEGPSFLFKPVLVVMPPART